MFQPTLELRIYKPYGETRERLQQKWVEVPEPGDFMSTLIAEGLEGIDMVINEEWRDVPYVYGGPDDES